MLASWESRMKGQSEPIFEASSAFSSEGVGCVAIDKLHYDEDEEFSGSSAGQATPQ